MPSVERHLARLKRHGVTCLRLMLEYAEGEDHFFERPAGRFNPEMVQVWDDLFALCERHGLRILLTPFDTFWTWLRWDRHPYNRLLGGPLAHPSQLRRTPPDEPQERLGVVPRLGDPAGARLTESHACQPRRPGSGLRAGGGPCSIRSRPRSSAP
ncbi:MAG TPA: hypothetical protein VF601_08695 [Beijerinckiaceae bacterium]